MAPTNVDSYFEPAPANRCAISKLRLGLEHAVFSPNWPCRSINVSQSKASPETKPAVVEIGKE
jgi:hypothetical protein